MKLNCTNIRAEIDDYSGGDYFVAICTRNDRDWTCIPN